MQAGSSPAFGTIYLCVLYSLIGVLEVLALRFFIGKMVPLWCQKGLYGQTGNVYTTVSFICNCVGGDISFKRY